MFVGFVLMQLIHDGRPGFYSRVRRQIRQTILFIIAKPADTDIIGRIARKPAVLVIRGGTGLARHVNAINPCQPAGAVFYRIGQQIIDIIRCGFRVFKYLLRRIVLVGEDGFAIGIHNLGIADGFRIIAIVRQRSVCLCHFTNRCTFGQRAQRHRRIIHIIIGGQRGKAQLFRHEII